MIITFLKNNRSYEIEPDEMIWLNAKQYLFTSPKIPAVEGGFFITFRNNEVDDTFSKYTTIYDKTEKGIIFTSDETIYNVFYLVNPNTNYVKGIIGTTKDKVENGVFVKYATGKEGEKPELDIYDEDGFYLHKIVDGKLVSTTAEDKEKFLKDKADAEARAKEQQFQSNKASKVDELKNACEAAIVFGVDVNGQHYSYSIEDQSNILNSMQIAMQTGLSIPYHADGELCRLYSLEEIVAIYVAEIVNLTHHQTYFNQMKDYVNNIDNEEDLEKVSYGVELTGVYAENYAKVMEQTQELVKAFTKKDEAPVEETPETDEVVEDTEAEVNEEELNNSETTEE